MIEINEGPLKEWVPAIIAGVFSLIVLLVTVTNKRATEVRTEQRDLVKNTRTEIERLRELEMATEASHSQDLTARFRTLMEGYENRIRDLTAELSQTRGDLKSLDKLYDERQKLCNTCPLYLATGKPDARTPT